MERFQEELQKAESRNGNMKQGKSRRSGQTKQQLASAITQSKRTGDNPATTGKITVFGKKLSQRRALSSFIAQNLIPCS